MIPISAPCSTQRIDAFGESAYCMHFQMRLTSAGTIKRIFHWLSKRLSKVTRSEQCTFWRLLQILFA